LQYKEGQFGKYETQTLLCIGNFGRANNKTSSTDDDDLCFTGAINGDLIVWKKNKINKIHPSAHNVS
jgi:hypothetical protein